MLQACACGSSWRAGGVQYVSMTKLVGKAVASDER